MGLTLIGNRLILNNLRWWPGTELNRRRQPFQGCALPPELPGHIPLALRTCIAWNTSEIRRTRHARDVIRGDSVTIITTASVSLNAARRRGRLQSRSHNDSTRPSTRVHDNL